MAIINADAKTVAHALTVVGKTKVVYCSNVGDAAAPVVLVAGDYTRQVGQCADHGHSIEPHARANGAVVVNGWHDGGKGWVAGCPDEHADAVREVIRRDDQRRQAEDAARQRAATDARANGRAKVYDEACEVSRAVVGILTAAGVAARVRLIPGSFYRADQFDMPGATVSVTGWKECNPVAELPAVERAMVVRLSDGRYVYGGVAPTGGFVAADITDRVK